VFLCSSSEGSYSVVCACSGKGKESEFYNANLLLSCSSVAIQFSPWNSVDVLHFSSVQFILVLAVLYDYIMSIAINSFLVLAIPKQFSLVHAVSYSVNNTE
jgi:hypothetical protein